MQYIMENKTLSHFDPSQIEAANKKMQFMIKNTTLLSHIDPCQVEATIQENAIDHANTRLLHVDPSQV